MVQNPTVPLAPMTPDAVLSAFRYLRAVEAGDTEAAAGFASKDPRMPALLADVAERIVVPITALCGIDPDPCDDSFALEAVGRVLVATLRGWAQAGPDAAEGVAHAIITFVAQVLTEEECGETVAGVLRQMEAVGFGQAFDGHPAPGVEAASTYQVASGSAASRASPTRSMSHPPHRPAGRSTERSGRGCCWRWLSLSFQQGEEDVPPKQPSAPSRTLRSMRSR
ncbi:hypothetical protein [Streptomyces sp. NPDC093600]|uniref:hypothetical protein n=1 Tax=Streptomyces sp. NPDC093600 TaxID=3366047 RepID=UPI003805453A